MWKCFKNIHQAWLDVHKLFYCDRSTICT
jgi:hypothetical protein